ncbi:MAG: glycoside hydrolase family 10 protein [Halanaerobium sp.]
MIKKTNLISLLVIVAAILVISSLNTLAYYQPEDYRKSLLDIRDAERSLNKLNQNLERAEAEFRIIEKSDIETKLESINNLYQQQLQAYQNNNDRQVAELAEKIINNSNQINLKSIESKPVQLRGFWLDSGTLAKTGGRSGLQEMLDLAEKANLNVIFPETFYKGLSIIPDNDLFTQDPRFEEWDGDPLKILLEEAEKRNMEVHPWVWVFNENTSGSPGRILEKNPEWANKNKKGEVVSYHNSTWLSPAREDVKEFLQKRYAYLVKNYELDGINLDYIRFPEEYRGSFGYDQKSVEKFKAEYGKDPFKISSGSSDFSLWNRYRENLITEMVRETSSKLKEIDSDLLISADVIPGRQEARYRALQNWSLWLEEDYLDFVLPMTYTENLFSELSSWIQEDRRKIDSPLYAGVSVFKLTPDQVIEQLEEINKINTNGNSLFAAAHLTEKDFQTLAEGIYSTEALNPHNNKEKSLEIMQDYILKRLNIIKEAGEIENSALIKIRGYLSQLLADETDIDFREFVKDNNLRISQRVLKVLEADFNYLRDIKRLY